MCVRCSFRFWGLSGEKYSYGSCPLRAHCLAQWVSVLVALESSRELFKDTDAPVSGLVPAIHSPPMGRILGIGIFNSPPGDFDEQPGLRATGLGSGAAVLLVWSLDQPHPGACQKSKFSGPTPDLPSPEIY